MSGKLSLAQVFPHIKNSLSPCFFLYGNNDILVQGILREIEESFSFCHVSFDNLNDHLRFLESPSLFGKKPLVTFVREGARQKGLQYFFEKWPKGLFLVVVAKSNFSSLEKCLNVKKVPCYEASIQESIHIFKRCIEKKRLSLGRDVLSFCAQQTKGGFWSEWALFLSLYPEHKINMDLVSEYSLLSEASELDCSLKPSFVRGFSFLEVRSYQKLFLQARWLKSNLLFMSPDQSFKNIYPFVFFKNAKRVREIAKNKSFEGIFERLEQYFFIEIKMKKREISQFL